MSKDHVSRRRFLRATLGTAAAGAAVPYFLTGAAALADETKSASKNDRLTIGQIGCGGQGNGDAANAANFGDVLAVCDVDSGRANRARMDNRIGKGKADVYEDYHKILDRKDIEAVVIGTPDHWHTKIAIDAIKAGKDIYCEKPLTLTIDEGKQICKVLKESDRVFQVGTQQRSSGHFASAATLVRQGQLGKIKKITVAIGGGPRSQSLQKTPAPSTLNWDMWLGQAPLVDYISAPVVGKKRSTPQSRCLYEFRWWLEYSGGKMTDWGAHHVDIAQWMLGADDTGPISLEGKGVFPVPSKDGMPTVDNQYNTALTFNITAKFADGIDLVIVDKHPRFGNGVYVEGEKGNLFVDRGRMTDEPEAPKWTRPVPTADEISKTVLKGQKHGNHMGNFVECIKTRKQPISDVYSHHLAMTTCHLANICIRLDRPLKWDPKTEQIIGDETANAFLKREQRKGYEIVV